MKTDELFNFVSSEQARSLQTELSTRVIPTEDSGFEPRFLCGMDVSYRDESANVAAAVWDVTSHAFVERIQVKGNAPVRYFPGLLGFREGPLIVSLSLRLKSKPDVFLIDGQGTAHPRRFGLACHFGVAVNRPTIGVAKSRLYGRVDNGMILDPERRVIGRVVTSPNHKQFYVSVGHRISIDAASSIVKASFVDGHPVPLRQAHLDSIHLRGSSSQ
jgi:deoxyribonuclease V